MRGGSKEKLLSSSALQLTMDLLFITRVTSPAFWIQRETQSLGWGLGGWGVGVGVVEGGGWEGEIGDGAESRRGRREGGGGGRKK